MFEMPVLDFAISLIFIFVLFSMLVSGLTAMWGDTLGWKNKFQKKSIRRLFNENFKPELGTVGKIMNVLRSIFYRKELAKAAIEAEDAKKRLQQETEETGYVAPYKYDSGDDLFELFKADPQIIQLFEGNPLPGLRKDAAKRFPSQITKGQFYEAILNILLQAGGDTPTSDPNETGSASNHSDAIYNGLMHLKPRYKFCAMLYVLYIKADREPIAFQASVEEWYSEYMTQASKDYKMHMRWPLFAVGFIVALFFNIDAVHIAERLWNNSTLRTEVLDAAVNFESEHSNVDSMTYTLQQFQDFSQATKLPIGWTEIFPMEDTFSTQNCSSSTVVFEKTEWTPEELANVVMVEDFFKLDSTIQHQYSSTTPPVIEEVKIYSFKLNLNSPKIRFWQDPVSGYYCATWRDTSNHTPLAFTGNLANGIYKAKGCEPPIYQITQAAYRDLGGSAKLLAVGSWIKNNCGGFFFKFFLGFLISGFLASFGAPFWFQLLQKLIRVRNGKKEK